MRRKTSTEGTKLSVCVAVLLWVAAALQAGVWPDQFGSFTKKSSGPAVLSQPEVWEEYGLQETEQAEYVSGKEKFKATAFRFRDPTGAMAAFQWQRPSGSEKSSLGQLAVQAGKVTLLAFHNYLFSFDGHIPAMEELEHMLARLPRLDQSSLPPLPDYLPAENIVPNSERYVMGPVTLAAFEPRLAPSLAAFHLGTEVQLARYKVGKAELNLAIFSFPTPSLARERAQVLSQLPGAMVKRTGPLVAMVLSPADPDAAERLLAKINYQASITWSEYVPTAKDNVGNLIIGILMLCGVLLLFCTVAGMAVGGLRVLRRKVFKRIDEEDPMIMLHLSD